MDYISIILNIIINILGISYVTVLRVILVIFFSVIVNYIIPDVEIDEHGQKENKTRAISLLMLNSILIVLTAHVIRNIVEWLPFPLDNLYGYKHIKLRERTFILLTAPLYMLIQVKFRKRLYMLLDIKG